MVDTPSEQPKMAKTQDENEDPDPEWRLKSDLEDSDSEAIVKSPKKKPGKTKGRVLADSSTEESEEEEESEGEPNPSTKNKRRIKTSPEEKPPAKKRRTGHPSVATKLTLHAAAPDAFNNKKTRKTKAKGGKVKKSPVIVKTEP